MKTETQGFVDTAFAEAIRVSPSDGIERAVKEAERLTDRLRAILCRVRLEEMSLGKKQKANNKENESYGKIQQ